MSNRYLIGILMVFSFISCQQQGGGVDVVATAGKQSNFRYYARAVGDSFSVSISLPAAYDTNKKYPVVYLLDANVYFDIMAVTLHKYATIGLLPDVVLVGIGYKDLAVLDSLRNRDYTYPVALPVYEMATSGGANHFLTFIKQELIPFVDQQYATDTTRRILMGHSLGGYFTTYAFAQQLVDGSRDFHGFIAASPSLNYNNYYLLHQLQSISPGTAKDNPMNVFVTFGGLEDQEDAADSGMIKNSVVMEQLSQLAVARDHRLSAFKTVIFSDLVHMDTHFPSFTKGLEWMLGEEKDTTGH